LVQYPYCRTASRLLTPARRLCLWRRPGLTRPRTGSQGSQKSMLLAGLLLKSSVPHRLVGSPRRTARVTPRLSEPPPRLSEIPGTPSSGAGPERPAYQ
jgi:hypothetical protein